ncbi:MAG TPA: mycofactocin precursor MftA [Ilumatobacteraceae bacterium]|jgi:mycofactocin precursor
METENVVVEQAADEAAVEEELLIEEISIDGMCGVY